MLGIYKNIKTATQPFQEENRDIRLSLGGEPLIESGGIKGVVHALGEHVDNIDTRVRGGTGVVVSGDIAEGWARGATGGASIGHVRGRASDAGDGVVAGIGGSLGGHVDGEGGGVGLRNSSHDDGVEWLKWE
jgi:hypothetical protein